MLCGDEQMENIEGFEKLYTLHEVAELMRLHIETIRAYVRDGRLEAIKPGKSYRVKESTLRAFAGQQMSITTKDEIVSEPRAKKKKAI
jgi:excisionase family DNA binding protein